MEKTSLALISPESDIPARDLIKAVARDIGLEVAHHIKTMYPEAVKAASSTFLLSVRGCVHNEVMAALESNADVLKRLEARVKFRRHIAKKYREIRGQVDDDGKETK